MATNKKFVRLLVFGVILVLIFILFVDNSGLKQGYTKYRSSGVHVSDSVLSRSIKSANLNNDTAPGNQNKTFALTNKNRRYLGPLPGIVKLEEEISVSRDLRDSIVNTHEKELLPGLIPPHAMYLWCDKRPFEFKHYISVMSIIKTLNPHKIYFYYEYPPVVDFFYYHQWLDDLIHDHPFFIYLQMPPYLTRYCTADRDIQVDMIMNLLNVEGAIYISENTWMLDFKHEMLLNNFVNGLESDNTDGFALMRGGILDNSTVEMVLRGKTYMSQRVTCATVQAIYNNTHHAKCLTVKGGRFETFKPMDIWDLDDPFGKIARKLYYGTEEILKPKPSYDTLVPNIGHMVWIGGGEMDFVFYLSALSVLYVVNVEALYIHGDLEPKGEYWQEIKKKKVPTATLR